MFLRCDNGVESNFINRARLILESMGMDTIFQKKGKILKNLCQLEIGGRVKAPPKTMNYECHLEDT